MRSSTTTAGASPEVYCYKLFHYPQKYQKLELLIKEENETSHFCWQTHSNLTKLFWPEMVVRVPMNKRMQLTTEHNAQ